MMGRRDRRDDGGAVLIWVALMMVAMLGIGALAVDLGYAYAVKRQVSVSADAAALAGAQAVGVRYAELHPAGAGCLSDDLSEYEDVAGPAAAATYQSNAPDGWTGDPDVTVSCEGAKINVTVRGESQVDTFLGGVLGVNSLSPAATAVAQVSGSPAYGKLRPFAVCIDDFPPTASAAMNNTYQTVFPQNWNTPKTCNTGSGQWGFVDFDGGSNPNPNIQDWTKYGYNGSISFPAAFIFGNPGGAVNPLTDELNYLVDNEVPILMPVADGWSGGGNPAGFHAPGVISAIVCGWSQDPKKVAEPTPNPDCWDQGLYDLVKESKAAFVLQWKYAAYSTSYTQGGESDDECSLTDQGCLPTFRLIE